MLWETGLRSSEALGLEPGNVKDNDVRIRRLNKKGRPWNQIPIQPQLALALRTYAQSTRVRKDRLFPV